MPPWPRRLAQLAMGLALAGAVVLLTQWAYPPGHLAIRLGRPYYSRAVGTDDVFVTVDITLQNVGISPIQIDREHFLLVDDAAHRYVADPSTHFLANHFDLLTIPPGYRLAGATVFKIPPGRRAARMMFVTNTGDLVSLPLG